MLTIFEGPDGGGKTTLINKWLLSQPRELSILTEMHRNGPYPGMSGAELMERYADQLPQDRSMDSTHHVFLDRCWISEMVYGNIMRGGSRLGRSEINGLAYAAKNARVMVIMCLPSYDACKTAYCARKELEYLPDEEKLRLVYNTYAQMKNNVDPRVFWFDREKDDTDEFIRSVEAVR